MGSHILLSLSLVGWIFAWSVPVRAAEQWPLQVVLYWEGHGLDEPNLEALEKLRIAYPELTLSHLINPSYFLDGELSESNLSAFNRVLKPDDEVGLYLSSIQPLIELANIRMRFQPTFWGHLDDREICQKDCGLDVPLSGRTREELLRLFSSADSALKQAGFRDMKTFAARGWLGNRLLQTIAQSFAYNRDLTALDPRLLSPKLRAFPFYRWAKDRWDEEASLTVPEIASFASSRVTQGGTLDFNEASEIIARFDKVNPALKPFQIALSQETAYFSSRRLQSVLKNLKEKAEQKDAQLLYQTASDTKNGRPIADPRHISKL